MTDTELEPGKVRLFDRVEPALRQGKYQIDLSQSLPTLPQLGSDDKDLSFSRYIEVVGERWSIDPLIIHQRLPPKNEQGVLVDSSIPKIVFQRKTLPWERVADDSDDNIPWMALLLIREDEMKNYCNLHLVEKGDGVLVSSLVGPSDPDADLRVDALQITEKLLEVIGPLQDEIPLLTHALQVDPMDKELCGNDEDGWFSVVLANRIPALENTKYFACLVSLDDGKIDLFDSGTMPPKGYVDPVQMPNVGADESSDSVHIPHEMDIHVQVEDIPTDGPLPDLKDPPGLVPDLKGEVLELEEEDIAAHHLSHLEKATGLPDDENRSGGGPLDLLLALPNFSLFRNRKNRAENKDASTTKSKESAISTSASTHAQMKENLETLGEMSEILSVPSQIAAGDYSGPSVHLPLLHYWSFNTGDGGDFESRMRNLRVRSREDSVESVGDLGAISDMIGRDGADYEPALLGNDMDPDVSVNSYLMTDIVCDDGITRPCLYRGPCIGVQLDYEPKESPYPNSDAAAGIEVGTGIEEISHSAAFELGRLLGMSDPNFIRSVSRWRRLRYRKNATISNQSVLVNKFDLDLDDIESGELFESKLIEMTLKDKYCIMPEVEEIMEMQKEICGTDSTPVDVDVRLQPESFGRESLPTEDTFVSRYKDVSRLVEELDFVDPGRGDY